MSALDDLACDPGNLRQRCQHCGQRSTGLCTVLVSRRIEALEVRIDEFRFLGEEQCEVLAERDRVTGPEGCECAGCVTWHERHG